MKQIDLRMEASADGRTTYEGSECRKCGGTLRHTSNGSCVACARIRAKNSSAKLRERLRKAREGKQ